MSANLIKNKIVKDANGNIKSITEYNKKGNIVYADGEVEVIKEYDEIGRLTHYKDSTGREHWYTYTLDENGNTIRTFTNQDGFTDTTILEYHAIEE